MDKPPRYIQPMDVPREHTQPIASPNLFDTDSEPSEKDFSLLNETSTWMEKGKFIQFDFGSGKFTCHTETLFKYPNSKLVELIKPRLTPSSKFYSVIIGRTDYIEHIFDFIVHDKFDLSRFTDEEVKRFNVEAEYYRLTELMKLCEYELESRRSFENGKLKLEQYDLIFFNHRQVTAVIDASKELGIIASSSVLEDKIELRDKFYSKFYPVKVYFCMDLHGEMKSAKSSFALYYGNLKWLDSNLYPQDLLSKDPVLCELVKKGPKSEWQIGARSFSNMISGYILSKPKGSDKKEEADQFCTLIKPYINLVMYKMINSSRS